MELIAVLISVSELDAAVTPDTGINAVFVSTNELNGELIE
jgi:hypothetical protein